MRRLAVLAMAILQLFGLGAAALEVGDEAPDFSVQGSDGKSHKLSDSVGKRGLVLAFFPKAFTPG